MSHHSNQISGQSLTPSQAFMRALSNHVGQQPDEESRSLVIGATRVSLWPQWADTIYLSTMRTHKNFWGQGSAGFAVTELTSLAKLFGVTLKTDCSGVNDPAKGLSTEQIKGMFERRGFESNGPHEMVFKPKDPFS